MYRNLSVFKYQSNDDLLVSKRVAVIKKYQDIIIGGERESQSTTKCVCMFVFFHGRPWQATDVPQPSWLIIPPALDFQTLATRCLRAYRRVPHSSLRAYRRVPHSSGGSWNLWAGTEDR
jgi:hypothetical protein